VGHEGRETVKADDVLALAEGGDLGFGGVAAGTLGAIEERVQPCGALFVGFSRRFFLGEQRGPFGLEMFSFRLQRQQSHMFRLQTHAFGFQLRQLLHLCIRCSFLRHAGRRFSSRRHRIGVISARAWARSLGRRPIATIPALTPSTPIIPRPFPYHPSYTMQVCSPVPDERDAEDTTYLDAGVLPPSGRDDSTFVALSAGVRG
jgi:hypothetical protein